MNSLNEIRARVARDGIGRIELATAAGVTPETVKRVLDDDDANPTLETLTKLDSGIDKVIANREAAAQAILAGTATAGGA